MILCCLLVRQLYGWRKEWAGARAVGVCLQLELVRVAPGKSQLCRRCDANECSSTTVTGRTWPPPRTLTLTLSLQAHGKPCSQRAYCQLLATGRAAVCQRTTRLLNWTGRVQRVTVPYKILACLLPAASASCLARANWHAAVCRRLFVTVPRLRTTCPAHLLCSWHLCCAEKRGALEVSCLSGCKCSRQYIQSHMDERVSVTKVHEFEVRPQQHTLHTICITLPWLPVRFGPKCCMQLQPAPSAPGGWWRGSCGLSNAAVARNTIRKAGRRC